MRTIHALPGMGADHRMYPHPWAQIKDLQAHDWPPFSGQTTIREVAIEMVDQHQIVDGDSLIGCSLGGIVACEITKVRRIDKLVLIGSACAKSEVSKLLSILHPLANIAPIEWVSHAAGKIPADLTQMFSGVDPSFIRAMCRAIFSWDGLGEHTTQLLRIHGRHDRVIPPPPSVHHLVDGGHLISMTHAEESARLTSAYLEG